VAKPLTCLDPQGLVWIVYDEDPAWKLVKKLDWLETRVLTKHAIITGELEEVREPPEWPDLPQLTDIILRTHRLYDCWRWLRGDRIGDFRKVTTV
jgi:hypothetical protein